MQPKSSLSIPEQPRNHPVLHVPALPHPLFRLHRPTSPQEDCLREGNRSQGESRGPPPSPEDCKGES